MQNYTTVGLALLISLVSTSIFAYCTFIGLDYGMDGNIAITLLIIITALGILGYSEYILIVSKASRNAREGRPKEIISAVIVFAVFLVGSIPFTKFIEVYNNRTLLKETMTETVAVIRTIDSAYFDYANKRIENVQEENKKSLKRRLFTSDIEKNAKERGEWLNSIHEANFWNVFTATNAHHLMEAADNWVEEYKSVSSVIYEGEECEPFQHEGFEEQINKFHEIFTAFHSPSGLSLLATLICFMCMMACYYATIRPTTKN